MKIDRVLAIVFGVLFLVTGSIAGLLWFKAHGPVTSFEDKLSYAIGQQIGSRVNGEKISLNGMVMGASIEDAIKKRPKKLTDQEIRDVLKEYMERQKKDFLAKFTGNKKKGEEYLEKNKTEAGVKVTNSGLQYKVIKEGKGASPKASDEVEVHYRGKLIDGREFDSSYSRKAPARFDVSGVVPGWTEALQLMREGSKFEIALPYNLAYGTDGQMEAGIEPYSTLLFEVELLKVFKGKGRMGKINEQLKNEAHGGGDPHGH